MDKTLLAIRDECIKETKLKISQSVSADLLVGQCINSIKEIDKVSNTMIKRLREWYAYYNPEFEKKFQDHEGFIELILKKSKKDLLQEVGYSENQTMGCDLKKEDLDMIYELARKLKDLHVLRTQEQEYLLKIMQKEYPNITAIAGYMIGAKLIELAKGIYRLSKFPSSTVQLLGAEKALFRHIKTGSDSPKYGILHEHPVVLKVSPRSKGRAARVLADKLSIAAKVDYFKGEFVGNKLKEDIDKKLGLNINRVQTEAEKIQEYADYEPKKYEFKKEREERPQFRPRERYSANKGFAQREQSWQREDSGRREGFHNQPRREEYSRRRENQVQPRREEQGRGEFQNQPRVGEYNRRGFQDQPRREEYTKREFQPRSEGYTKREFQPKREEYNKREFQPKRESSFKRDAEDTYQTPDRNRFEKDRSRTSQSMNQDMRKPRSQLNNSSGYRSRESSDKVRKPRKNQGEHGSSYIPRKSNFRQNSTSNSRNNEKKSGFVSEKFKEKPDGSGKIFEKKKFAKSGKGRK